MKKAYHRNIIKESWEKQPIVPGKDPKRWRMDNYGNPVMNYLIGCKGPYCFDCICPAEVISRTSKTKRSADSPSSGSSTAPSSSQYSSCLIVQSSISPYLLSEETSASQPLPVPPLSVTKNPSLNRDFNDMDDIEMAVYGDLKEFDCFQEVRKYIQDKEGATTKNSSNYKAKS